jgi:hypothetical protein
VFDDGQQQLPTHQQRSKKSRTFCWSFELRRRQEDQEDQEDGKILIAHLKQERG